MYNEALKNQFVTEYAKSISKSDVCISAFNAMAPYEEQWGADLCTKTQEELEPVVENLVGFRVQSKWLRLSIYRDYVKWCLANNVPGACDGMLKVEALGLSKVRTQMVANPLQLHRYLDLICESESEETTDLLYRCFYWLSFCGLEEEDIFKVKCSDVDFYDMVIRHDGYEYEIYRESIPTLKRLATLDEFVYKHPNYLPGKTVYRHRVPGDILIRGVRTVPSARSMRSELTKRSKLHFDAGHTDKQLSHYRVWLSGLFYRMYERERAGMPVDFSAEASKYMEGRTYKFDSKRNTVDAKRRVIMGEFLQDYYRWKAALLT